MLLLITGYETVNGRNRQIILYIWGSIIKYEITLIHITTKLCGFLLWR